MCTKVRYTSKRHARLANANNGKTLFFYVCPECPGFWHSSKDRYKRGTPT